MWIVNIWEFSLIFVVVCLKHDQIVVELFIALFVVNRLNSFLHKGYSIHSKPFDTKGKSKL